MLLKRGASGGITVFVYIRDAARIFAAVPSRIKLLALVAGVNSDADINEKKNQMLEYMHALCPVRPSCGALVMADSTTNSESYNMER